MVFSVGKCKIAIGLQTCLQVGNLKDADLLAPEMMCIVKGNCCGKALEIAMNCRDSGGKCVL